MRIWRVAQEEEDMVQSLVSEWDRQSAIVQKSIPAMIREIDHVVVALDKDYANSEEVIQKYNNIRMRTADAYKHILEAYHGFEKVAPDTDAERWVRDLVDKAETCLAGVAEDIGDLHKGTRVLRDKADEFRGALVDMRAELEKMLKMGVQS